MISGTVYPNNFYTMQIKKEKQHQSYAQKEPTRIISVENPTVVDVVSSLNCYFTTFNGVTGLNRVISIKHGRPTAAIINVNYSL